MLEAYKIWKLNPVNVETLWRSKGQVIALTMGSKARGKEMTKGAYCVLVLCRNHATERSQPSLKRQVFPLVVSEGTHQISQSHIITQWWSLNSHIHLCIQGVGRGVGSPTIWWDWEGSQPWWFQVACLFPVLLWVVDCFFNSLKNSCSTKFFGH